MATAQASILSFVRNSTVLLQASKYQDFWLPPQINFRPISIFFQDPTDCQLDISGSSAFVYTSSPGGGANSNWVTNINSSHLYWFQILSPAQVIRITNNAGSSKWIDICVNSDSPQSDSLPAGNNLP